MIIPLDALSALRNAQSIGVLTGAGVSAESGIATFRDAQTGLWSNYRPEDLATPQAFERDPALVWQWYCERRKQVTEANPNAAHKALAALQTHRGAHIITQNVDGLHQRAGANDVIELHGSIVKTVCSQTGQVVPPELLDEQCPPGAADTPTMPPPSPFHPDGLCRPGVVWFGEALPAQALDRAFEIAHSCQVFISAGTSTVVEPAASLPLAAKRAGAFLIEINPAQTPLTPHCDAVLPGAAGEILPRLVAALGL
ncbi:MAG: NAD-dependent deacetylase [Lysobacterales bacterium]